ncbi:ATP-dependent helicase/deoxyribonuclease subunit B [Alienimonas californiensis]|uniref:ATP-dependent helicase/deoxyribonuclease subunit B n=1 Tax=Alienimonas californiensis TaxID=2527989 RepID=A0A517PD32_9PLAN|nr:ATP-dependent helicase/deoxyribonuclease subunit B [Alienimonas californiensis]
MRLLCGTPRGGKTGALLAEYAAALQAAWAEGRTGACLWLTPNRLSRAAVQSDLAREIGGPLLEPGVRTFENLTDELLSDGRLWHALDAAQGAPSREPAGGEGRRYRVLSGVSRRRVLRAVIDAEAAAGRLSHFARIAGAGGFLTLLERQVRAWKYAEVWPDDPTLQSGGAARRDLVRLYAAYQDRLQNPPDGGPPLFDAEGRVWVARNLLCGAGAALGSDGSGNGRRLDLLVADGFTSFTATQRDLLAALAASANAAVIALPLEQGSGMSAKPRPGVPYRPDLFEPVWRTVDELSDPLAEQGGESIYQWHAPRRPDDALGHLAAWLFDESAEPAPRRTVAKGVTLYAAGRIEDEARATVAAVKGLLMRGEPAERVVVTARDVGTYAEEFFRLCDAGGVPVDADRPLPLAGRPAVRALLAPWRVEASGWGLRGLLGVLRDPSFGFPADAATATARVLRFANVGEDRRTALKAVRTFAPAAEGEEPKPPDRDAPPEADRRLTAAAVEALNAALEPTRTATDPAGWVARLRTLIETLGFNPAAAELPREPWEDDAADLDAALRWLSEAAAEHAADADPNHQADDGLLSLGEFLHWADELLAAARVPGPPAAAGGVAFVDAETARTAGCDHLFLLGLGEGQFPRPPNPADPAPPRSGEEADDPAALADANARAEMLLFYGVVTRPTKSLTLSWTTRDEKGRERFAGPFVEAVRDLFAPDTFPEPKTASLSPIPALDRALTAADARALAVSELRTGGQAGPLARLLVTPGEAPAARCVLGAATMLSARSRTKGPTAFDGRLSTRSQVHWAKRRPVGYQFSASELETFAANPFRYFLDRVLRVERPDPPGLREDRMNRGTAMHAALSRAYRRALEQSEDAPTVELLQEEIAALKPRSRSLARWHDGLWETERALLAAWSEAFPTQAAAYAGTFAAGWAEGPTVHRLEAAFGRRTPEEEDDTEDLSQRPPAARFPNDPGGVPVTGRIDRLDFGFVTLESGETVPAYNIVDYKTGSSVPKFTAERVAAGASLQLALYAVAARRCGLTPPDAEPHMLVYWGVKTEGPRNGISRGGKKCVAELLPTLEEDLDAVVPLLAGAIRSGVFPICPEKGETQTFSDHARVGRAAEVRAVAERLEKWPPPWRTGPVVGDEDE